MSKAYEIFQIMHLGLSMQKNSYSRWYLNICVFFKYVLKKMLELEGILNTYFSSCFLKEQPN